MPHHRIPPQNRTACSIPSHATQNALTGASPPQKSSPRQKKSLKARVFGYTALSKDRRKLREAADGSSAAVFASIPNGKGDLESNSHRSVATATSSSVRRHLLLVPESASATTNNDAKKGSKWRKCKKLINGIEMMVWKAGETGALNLIRDSKRKLERYERGYIEEIFPWRSDMHTERISKLALLRDPSESINREDGPLLEESSYSVPWFKTMKGRLMAWDLPKIDEYVMSTHFPSKPEILQSIQSLCHKPIEQLRMIYLLACKYEWDAYHVRDWLREIGWEGKVWVCEGVLKGIQLPGTHEDDEQDTEEHLDDGIDMPSRRDSSPAERRNDQTNETVRRHSWVVVRFSRGQRTSDGARGVYYIMDTKLGRLCVDAPSDDDNNQQDMGDSPLTEQVSMPSPHNTQSDTIALQRTSTDTSSPIAPSFNDFWFLVPPMMLRFTHFASRVQNRNALTEYEQLLPDLDASNFDQSPSVEQYPQSIQEFERGPAMSLNALYLGIFPRNSAARLSMQILNNYVKLEYDSVTRNKIDVSFRITSLDDNPFKEAYHIWESYPTTHQLLIHFIFRSRGIYKVEMMMRFDDGDMSLEEFPYLHVFTYVFHVKRGMKREVGGFNVTVFNSMNFHDTLHQVESPLQQLLQSNTVYNFQVLLNTQIFSGAAVLLSTSAPVQAVQLVQQSKKFDVDSHLQLFESDVLLEKKRKTVHLIGFLKNDTNHKCPVHISSWNVASELPLVQGDENDKSVEIAEHPSQLGFLQANRRWIENSLYTAEKFQQQDEHTDGNYTFNDETIPPLIAIPDIQVIRPHSNPEPDIIVLETEQQKLERLASEQRHRWLNMTQASADADDTASESTMSLRGDEDTVSEKLSRLMPLSATDIELPHTTNKNSSRLQHKPDALNQTMTSLRRLSVGAKSTASESSLDSPLTPIEPSEAERNIEMAQKKFSQRFFDEAIKLWKAAVKAQPDNEEVLFDLAVACEEVGNHTEALQYYTRASDLGHVEAMMSVASAASESGDHVVACKYLEKASAENRIEAIYALGVHYSTGKGVNQDAVQAFKLFKKAADSGHVLAKYNVGHYYCRGIKYNLETDFEKARSYFYEASEMDHLPSITSLGWLHEHGMLKVEQSMQRALEYYNRAASLGESTAWYNIGMIYLRGCSEVPRDEEKGLQYLQKAMGMGEPRAARTLKHMNLRTQYEQELETITQIYRGEAEFPEDNQMGGASGVE